MRSSIMRGLGGARGAVQRSTHALGVVTAGVTLASQGRYAPPLDWLRERNLARQQGRGNELSRHRSIPRRRPTNRRCLMKPIERLTLFCALAAVASACDSDKRLFGPDAAQPLVAAASGVPFTEGLASPAWQETARNVIMRSTLLSGNSTRATRVYAYLSVAQYDAVVRAEDALGGDASETQANARIGLGAGGRSPLRTDRRAGPGPAAPLFAHLRPPHPQQI